MASITYWSQLLPSPCAPSVAESLAARVRDPAWLLARQWQLGEFQGADAGSPAFVRIGSHTAGLTSATVGSATTPLANQALLEPLVESEPFIPTWPPESKSVKASRPCWRKAAWPRWCAINFVPAYPIVAAPAAVPGTPDAAAQAANGRLLESVCGPRHRRRRALRCRQNRTQQCAGGAGSGRSGRTGSGARGSRPP